MGCLK